MAVALLNETLLSYVHRRNQISVETVRLQNQKSLATSETSDLADWKAAQYSALRAECKNIFATTYEHNDKYSYSDYTEIPEYQDEVEYIDSYYEAEVADLNAWETQIDNQISMLSVELQEINAFQESFKSYLKDNISNDYQYAEGM